MLGPLVRTALRAAAARAEGARRAAARAAWRDSAACETVLCGSRFRTSETARATGGRRFARPLVLAGLRDRSFLRHRLSPVKPRKKRPANRWLHAKGFSFAPCWQPSGTDRPWWLDRLVRQLRSA